MSIENKKYCPECGMYRNKEEFKKLSSPSALKKYSDGYYWCCGDCYKNKTWTLSPEKDINNRKIRRRMKRLRRIASVEYTYGLTEERYMAKIQEQKNLCAICHKKYEGRVLCVDHNHDTGEVRGLLCDQCNIGLGNFKDDDKILLSAIGYLHKYSLRPSPPGKDKERVDIIKDPAKGNS